MEPEPSPPDARKTKLDEELLQRRLGAVVGHACARAWWQDAAEQEACAPPELVRLLAQGAAGTHQDLRGAAWISCAFEDAVGTAGAMATAKAQLGPLATTRPT
eukprot:symbB.v1.2.040888.t1/scaffold7626.1/size10169/1